VITKNVSATCKFMAHSPTHAIKLPRIECQQCFYDVSRKCFHYVFLVFSSPYSKLILFSFAKNLALALPNFWFAFASSFSGQVRNVSASFLQLNEVPGLASFIILTILCFYLYHQRDRPAVVVARRSTGTFSSRGSTPSSPRCPS
jgi:hypothetical protein